jgi:hypothetical protein
MRRYYFFEPLPMRLPRAWRQEVAPVVPEEGVHRTAATGIRMYPQNFILRHYIVLSHEQAVRKYVGRQFAQHDLQIGWHNNRLNLDANKLALPGIERLHELPSADSRDFRRDAPQAKHYWEW